MNSPDYTFVTTCKGRLHHLRQTLPSLLETHCAGIVVVDYACPDGTANWVEQHYPKVTVVRVTDDAGFCLARARNIGANAVKSSWIAFIDADVSVHDGWDAWLQNHLRPATMYRAGAVNSKVDQETYGTFICEKTAFDRVGGYDESFTGWGGEDVDLYRRLTTALVAQQTYPGALVTAISHGDDERTRFAAIKDTRMHQLIGELYMRAKSFYAGFLDYGRVLPLEERKKLMAFIVKRVQAWDSAGRPVGTRVEVGHKSVKWLPAPYAMAVDASIALTINEKKDVTHAPLKPSREDAQTRP